MYSLSIFLFLTTELWTSGKKKKTKISVWAYLNKWHMHKAWHLFHFKPIKTKYFHLDLMLLHIKVLPVARGQTQNMFQLCKLKKAWKCKRNSLYTAELSIIINYDSCLHALPYAYHYMLYILCTEYNGYIASNRCCFESFLCGFVSRCTYHSLIVSPRSLWTSALCLSPQDDLLGKKINCSRSENYTWWNNAWVLKCNTLIWLCNIHGRTLSSIKKDWCRSFISALMFELRVGSRTSVNWTPESL